LRYFEACAVTRVELKSTAKLGEIKLAYSTTRIMQ